MAYFLPTRSAYSNASLHMRLPVHHKLRFRLRHPNSSRGRACPKKNSRSQIARRKLEKGSPSKCATRCISGHTRIRKFFNHDLRHCEILMRNIVPARVVRTSDNSRPAILCNKGMGQCLDHNDHTDTLSQSIICNCFFGIIFSLSYV
jgi:hypothetical protein